ncbi:hypothetical protein LguiA_020710 [Lonicera macranthoides]
MERETKAYKAHCLVVPFPCQGHINPMLQFSRRLEHKGLRVTIAVTQHLYKTTQRVSSSGSGTGSISVETISDGKEYGELHNIRAYLERFQEVGSQTLTQLVKKLSDSGCPVDCIVYDAFMPWALDIVKRFGLVGAAFFTQSCAVNNIYYHVYKGLIELPLREDKILVPGLPELQRLDMPSFMSDFGSYPAIFEMLGYQFSNFDKADWLLVNSFYELEEEVVDWMAKLGRLKTIGPTIPSNYLDKRLKDDNDYGLNMFNPKTDTCMTWLSERLNGSVAYVAFGSLAELGIEQMEELSQGLKKSGKYFLWVVRASEEDKLPKNFVEETCEKGLVVSWCPQLEVLAHKAIGCFVTHCGWNSTLEALSLGVPVMAMPQWTDQLTNAKYALDVWRNGVRPQINEKGIVTSEVIKNCLIEIIEGVRGKEIQRNSIKWEELAKKSVNEGGSSDKNIDEFVSTLVNM